MIQINKKGVKNKNMKINKKNLILLLIVVLVIIIMIFFVVMNRKGKDTNENVVENNDTNFTDQEGETQFYEELEDGTKVNTSEKLKETKILNGLEIKNIQLTNKNNQSMLLAEIENKTGKETQEILINVIFSDKEGNQIGKIGGMIAPLKDGEKTKLSSSSMKDYSNAYNFEIKIKE